jgi:hypothetical protein
MILKDMLLIVVFTAWTIEKSVILALSLVKSRSLGFSHYSSVNIKCPFEMYALFAFSKKFLSDGFFLLKALMNLSILILFAMFSN